MPTVIEAKVRSICHARCGIPGVAGFSAGFIVCSRIDDWSEAMRSWSLRHPGEAPNVICHLGLAISPDEPALVTAMFVHPGIPEIPALFCAFPEDAWPALAAAARCEVAFISERELPAGRSVFEFDREGVVEGLGALGTDVGASLNNAYRGMLAGALLEPWVLRRFAAFLADPGARRPWRAEAG